MTQQLPKTAAKSPVYTLKASCTPSNRNLCSNSSGASPRNHFHWLSLGHMSSAETIICSVQCSTALVQDWIRYPPLSPQQPLISESQPAMWSDGSPEGMGNCVRAEEKFCVLDLWTHSSLCFSFHLRKGDICHPAPPHKGFFYWGETRIKAALPGN